MHCAARRPSISARVSQLQVQNLFRPRFVEEAANVVFVGGVGLGESHLVTALIRPLPRALRLPRPRPQTRLHAEIPPWPVQTSWANAELPAPTPAV